jgi:hypothetical protein
MLPSERRSTMRVNKERLKAAMEAADRAEASGAAPDGTQDSVWEKQDELLRNAGSILDDIKRFDHNFNIAASVATTIGTIVNSNELAGLLDSTVLATTKAVECNPMIRGLAISIESAM